MLATARPSRVAQQVLVALLVIGLVLLADWPPFSRDLGVTSEIVHSLVGVALVVSGYRQALRPGQRGNGQRLVSWTNT